MNSSTPPNSSNVPVDNDWSDCQAGELCSLGERLRGDFLRQKHNAAYLKVATSALVLMLVFGAGHWLSPGENSRMKIGGITCNECVPQFDSYQAHLASSGPMDAKQAEQMHDHLAGCDLCRSEFEAKFPGLLSDSLQATGRLLAHRRMQPFYVVAALL